MKPINGGANDRASAPKNRLHEFVCQRCLADSVHAINRNTNGMRSSDGYNSLRQHFNCKRSLHGIRILARVGQPTTLYFSAGVSIFELTSTLNIRKLE